MVDLLRWGRERAPQGVADLTRPGRVVRVDRGECDVATDDGILRVASDSMRSQNEMAPVTGDWVDIGHEEGIGPVIAQILPRSTTLSRRDPAERDIEQVLAANVDLVGVVHGLDRPLPPGRLERLLVLAGDSGAVPVVILTKSDQADSGDDTIDVVRAVIGDRQLIVTSIESGEGIEELRASIDPGFTLALIGPSGVGKSSLVNALVGDEVLEVGEVRQGDSKGRHTTTARELVPLVHGGLILDTPGIRSLGLWSAEEALDRVFGDLEVLAGQCRFNDCGHGSEPGCAVRQAVADGEVDGRRVDRYLLLRDELDAQRQREEQRQRRDKKTGGRRPGRRR